MYECVIFFVQDKGQDCKNDDLDLTDLASRPHPFIHVPSKPRDSWKPPTSDVPKTNRPTPAPRKPIKPGYRRCMSLFDRVADNKDELSFREGEIIGLLRKEKGEWWEGMKENQPNRRGLLPRNSFTLLLDHSHPIGINSTTSSLNVRYRRSRPSSAVGVELEACEGSPRDRPASYVNKPVSRTPDNFFGKVICVESTDTKSLAKLRIRSKPRVNVVQLKDKKEADEFKEYIKESLYSQTQLNELCCLHGRKSENVSRACDLIVYHLKEKIDNILCSNNKVLHIYPAFKVEQENEIIFVLTLSKTTDIAIICDAVAYSVEIRFLHKFSNELNTLMDTVQEEGHGISHECQRPIAVAIGKWAKPLLKAHKYLSVITASPLKSRRNNDKEILQSFVREPECCIVFCVHAKDFIYIKDDPLPAKLNGISTDVMEGAFVTFGRLAHESHDTLPMGCELGREESTDIGTLGGFIDHPEYGLCGITSGHICLDHAEYDACVKNNGRLMLTQWPEGSRGRRMFQPAKLRNGVEVGQLVEVLYQVGSHLESGFDVALFQIENKYPEDGNFPAEKINDKLRDVGYTFKGGNVCGLTRAAGKPLWKFGRTSGSTTGKANLKTPTAVKEAPFYWKTPDKYQITLMNQFEVSPIDIGQNKMFANHGDSGALVFIDEDKDDLKCVGMVAGGVGGTSIAIISPISPILKHCNVTKFHSFYNTPRQNSEAMQSLEKRLEQRMDTMYSRLDQRIDDNFRRLFTMLEQQSNKVSNTSNHEERPSTREMDTSSKE